MMFLFAFLQQSKKQGKLLPSFEQNLRWRMIKESPSDWLAAFTTTLLLWGKMNIFLNLIAFDLTSFFVCLTFSFIRQQWIKPKCDVFVILMHCDDLLHKRASSATLSIHDVCYYVFERKYSVPKRAPVIFCFPIFYKIFPEVKVWSCFRCWTTTTTGRTVKLIGQSGSWIEIFHQNSTTTTPSPTTTTTTTMLKTNRHILVALRFKKRLFYSCLWLKMVTVTEKILINRKYDISWLLKSGKIRSWGKKLFDHRTNFWTSFRVFSDRWLSSPFLLPIKAIFSSIKDVF